MYDLLRIGGMMAIMISWLVTWYTLWQLVQLHESKPGTRVNWFTELLHESKSGIKHTFGEKFGYRVVQLRN